MRAPDAVPLGIAVASPLLFRGWLTRGRITYAGSRNWAMGWATVDFRRAETSSVLLGEGGVV